MISHVLRHGGDISCAFIHSCENSKIVYPFYIMKNVVL